MTDHTHHLYDACFRGNWALVDQILNKDKEETHEGVRYRHPQTGASVLHVAVARHAPLSVVRTLVEKARLDPNVVDSAGCSPLHSACKYRAPLDIVQYLLARGANPNLRAHRDGPTPLHFAAQFHALPTVVQALLVAGADVNQRKSSGATPLFVAVDNEADAPLVQVLLQAGADCHVKATDPITHLTQTLIGVARKKCSSRVVKLIEAHAHGHRAETTRIQELSRHKLEAARLLFRYAVSSNSMLTLREDQPERPSEQVIAVRAGDTVKLIHGTLEEGVFAPFQDYVLVVTSNGRLGKVKRSILYDPATLPHEARHI